MLIGFGPDISNCLVWVFSLFFFCSEYIVLPSVEDCRTRLILCSEGSVPVGNAPDGRSVCLNVRRVNDSLTRR